MAASFRIDQATPGQGVADRSRHDLVPSEEITLTAIEPVGGYTYEWEIIDKVGTTATLSATTGASVTIGASSSRPFGFLIEMRVLLGGNVVEKVQRIASCRSQNLNLRVPLFPETAAATATLQNRQADRSTDNAVYNDRAGTGQSEQNFRGWAEAWWELVKAVDSLASAGLHASTHEAGGIDEIEADSLAVSYTPENYSTGEDTTLGAHLAAIDGALGDTGPHAATHVEGGDDEIDGGSLAIDYTPESYTPAGTDLGAHLAAIDAALGSISVTVDTDDVANESDVEGETATEALNALNTSLGSIASAAVMEQAQLLHLTESSSYDDLDPGGSWEQFEGPKFMALSADQDVEITGLVRGPHSCVIFVQGEYRITLTHQDTDSTSLNRFYLAVDRSDALVLSPGDIVHLHPSSEGYWTVTPLSMGLTGLPDGTDDGQILRWRITEGVGAWELEQPPSGGGGGGLTPTALQDSSYAAADGDLVLVDISAGDVEVTLPAVSAGAQIAVKVVGAANANTCTVTPDGSEEIDGESEIELDLDNEFVHLYGTSAGWIVGARS